MYLAYSVSLAVPACSCGALPNTAELNQPLHEYTQMESCAQLTGEIGAWLAPLPPPWLPSALPQARGLGALQQGKGGSTQLGPEGMAVGVVVKDLGLASSGLDSSTPVLGGEKDKGRPRKVPEVAARAPGDSHTKTKTQAGTEKATEAEKGRVRRDSHPALWEAERAQYTTGLGLCCGLRDLSNGLAPECAELTRSRFIRAKRALPAHSPHQCSHPAHTHPT